MVKIRRKDKTFFQFITPNAPLLAGRGADWQELAISKMNAKYYFQH